MTQSKKDLQQAIIDGAIEAAEIISQRAVQDESDRLKDEISKTEQAQKERVDAALQTVRSLVAVLQETQTEASTALQQDLLRTVDVLRKTADEAARSATEDGITALEAKLQSAAAEMSKRVIDYVDERHDVAIRSMTDQDALRYDELRQKLNEDAQALIELQEKKAADLTRSVAEVLEQQKDGVREILEQALTSMDDAERGLVQIITERYAETEKSVDQIVADLRAEHDRLSEDARDLLDDALISIESRISRAIEDSRENVDALRTELFLATEEFQNRTQGEIQKALDALEIPDPVPGPAGEQGEPGPPGEKGDPGALTRVEIWHEDREYARRACVSHKGGIWQARSDTEEEPGHSVHWSSLVESIYGARRVDGRIILLRSDGEETDLGDFQGPPGREWNHAGTYEEGKKDYGWGDVVILRGTSYVARKDAPGTCPGKDWRMVAQAKQGPAGKPGRTGKQGLPGPPGPVGPPGQSIGPWRGKWTSTEGYGRNEIVNFAHALWIALQEVPAGETPKADQVYWDLFLRANVGGGGGSGGGGIGTDELVGVTSNDAAPGHLNDKVQSGDGSVIFSVVNAGGDEVLDLQATGAGGGEANVGDNLGAGVGWYHGKSGVILQFRSAVDSGTITWTLNGTEVSATVPANTFDAFGAAAAVQSDLDSHKTSADHDGRYYTQSQLDTQLAAKVNVAGDTMTGLLTLSGNPTQNLHAAPRQYVDTEITTVNDALNAHKISGDHDARYATTAQGALADTAVQPGDNADTLGSGAATNGQVLTADGLGNAAWQAGGGGSNLHADLTDTDTDGHPGSVITIAAGVQGNAVSIAADGSLQDSGVPPGGAGGTTDLSNTPSATEVTIESSSGQDTSVAAATQTLAGVLSAADKAALDGTDAAGTPRPPTNHANTHATGQADAIAPADIGAATTAQGALADTAVQPGDDADTLGSGVATDGQVLTADGAGNSAWEDAGAGGHVIQDEGVALPARANLNFLGAGVTAADDAGNDATTVTIPGGAGGGGYSNYSKRSLLANTAPQPASTNIIIRLDEPVEGDDSLWTNGQYVCPPGGGGIYCAQGRIGFNAGTGNEDSSRIRALIRKNTTDGTDGITYGSNDNWQIQQSVNNAVWTLYIPLSPGDTISLLGNHVNSNGDVTFFSTVSDMLVFKASD